MSPITVFVAIALFSGTGQSIRASRRPSADYAVVVQPAVVHSHDTFYDYPEGNTSDNIKDQQPSKPQIYS
jgi:hypothetical protein